MTVKNWSRNTLSLILFTTLVDIVQKGGIIPFDNRGVDSDTHECRTHKTGWTWIDSEWANEQMGFCCKVYTILAGAIPADCHSMPYRKRLIQKRAKCCHMNYNKVFMKCDYCLNEAELVSGYSIYPHRPDLYHKNFYQCKPCDAWVGCHPNTTNPLGRLADSWLAKELDIPVKFCHVGMFDIETCQKALNILAKKSQPPSHRDSRNE